MQRNLPLWGELYTKGVGSRFKIRVTTGSHRSRWCYMISYDEIVAVIYTNYDKKGSGRYKAKKSKWACKEIPAASDLQV
jgi:hypothetical protein